MNIPLLRVAIMLALTALAWLGMRWVEVKTTPPAAPSIVIAINLYRLSRLACCVLEWILLILLISILCLL